MILRLRSMVRWVESVNDYNAIYEFSGSLASHNLLADLNPQHGAIRNDT